MSAADLRPLVSRRGDQSVPRRSARCAHAM